MKIRKRIYGLLLIVLIGVMIGCQDNSPQDLESELGNSGKVIFKLTDAPFPSELVAEANITVDWVKLHTETESEEEEAENDEEEVNSTNIYTIELAEDSTFNLLELSNGITAFLGEVVVPAGLYKEIRMHIKDADVILNDGTVYDLKVPGGNKSGLKIKINPTLVVNEGEVVEVLLDVDVSRSFVVRGNLNHPKGKNNVKGFVFKPVVRAVPQFTSGRISGLVSDTSNVLLENAMLSLINNEDTVTTALTSADGYYAIVGIPEGTYHLACSKNGYKQQMMENIDVRAGDIIEQNFQMVPVNE